MYSWKKFRLYILTGTLLLELLQGFFTSAQAATPTAKNSASQVKENIVFDADCSESPTANPTGNAALNKSLTPSSYSLFNYNLKPQYNFQNVNANSGVLGYSGLTQRQLDPFQGNDLISKTVKLQPAPGKSTNFFAQTKEDACEVGEGSVPCEVGGGEVLCEVGGIRIAPPIGGGEVPPIGGGEVPPIGGGFVPPIGLLGGGGGGIGLGAIGGAIGGAGALAALVSAVSSNKAASPQAVSASSSSPTGGAASGTPATGGAASGTSSTGGSTSGDPATGGSVSQPLPTEAAPEPTTIFCSFLAIGFGFLMQRKHSRLLLRQAKGKTGSLPTD